MMITIPANQNQVRKKETGKRTKRKKRNLRNIKCSLNKKVINSMMMWMKKIPNMKKINYYLN